MRPTFAVASVFSVCVAAVTIPAALPSLLGGSAMTWSFLGTTHAIDPLSAFFILLINTAAVLGALYGTFYRGLDPRRAGVSNVVHAFAYAGLHVSMLGVVIVSDLLPLLAWWEAMSVTSFLLVLDHGHTRSRNAAVKYIIQMQVGAAFLLTGIGLASVWGRGLSFHALGTILTDPSGWTIAVPLVIGFAMKAGVVPLHTWLPDAHGSAPSHVSGVLSGVMVKLGLYGILRVLLLSHDHAIAFGAPLMIAGMITAIYGIAQAAVQNDIKRLLAYSTIENMGLIIVNIGLALVATGAHAPVIATVAWSAVVLHMIHHLLVKTTAFQSVGIIVHSTHTQDLNAMGGLLKVLPRAGTLLLISAVAISAIPPLSGFISEFSMFSASMRAMGDANTVQSILALFAVLTVCVVGGMTIVAMTKAVGIGLLGTPRSASVPAHGHEPWRVVAAPVIAAFGLLAVGLAPAVVLDAVSGLLFQLPSSDEAALRTLRGTYVMIGWMNASLIVLSVVMIVVRARVRAARPIAAGPTWGCGYTTADARVQYTSTTYGDSVLSLAEGFVHVHRDLRPIDDADSFPHQRTMHTHHRDQVERLVLEPTSGGIVNGLRKLAVFQTGNLRTYILYALGFLIVFAGLTILGVI